MQTPVDDIWLELKATASLEELFFLKYCFRAYSSNAHVKNVMDDLSVLKRLSPPPQKILDLGCGIGLQSFLLSKAGYFVNGLETVKDKSINILKRNAESYKSTREEGIKKVWRLIKRRTNVIFKFYNGRKIPFSNEHFDIVFTYAVIEHIPPDEISNIIEEINRVLKINGLFYIFQLPQRTSYTEFIARHLRMQSHEFLWCYQHIKNLLNRKGFEVIFQKKADMLINHPYKLVNPIFPLLHPLNKLLIHTPLSYFAHHLTVISKKNRR